MSSFLDENYRRFHLPWRCPACPAHQWWQVLRVWRLLCHVCRCLTYNHPLTFSWCWSNTKDSPKYLNKWWSRPCLSPWRVAVSKIAETAFRSTSFAFDWHGRHGLPLFLSTSNRQQSNMASYDRLLNNETIIEHALHWCGSSVCPIRTYLSSRVCTPSIGSF